MPEIPASQPRHIVHGTAAAFTTLGPVVAGFKFVYGTWSSPDAGVGQVNGYGVIQNYTLTKIGDVSNLKDGGGSTFAHAVIDPGYKITASILHAYTDAGNASPRQGGRINFRKILEGVVTATRSHSGGVVTGTGGKARFSISTTAGYVVGEMVMVGGTIYNGIFPVVSIDSGTTITLDTPYTASSTTGSLWPPASVTNPTLKAVVTGLNVKWEHQGWRMLEIEAEARDSINLGTTYGTVINELGVVTSVVYDGT